MKTKTLSLKLADVDPAFDKDIVARLTASVRNVRLDAAGYFAVAKPSRRPPDAPGRDWRFFFEKHLKRVFPWAWVYRGGHHISFHRSPPVRKGRFIGQTGTGIVGQAGPLLFAIVECPPEKTV